MEIAVWVLGNDRRTMIANQRRINASGSMRCICLLTSQSFEKAIQDIDSEEFVTPPPAMVVMDYDYARQVDFAPVSILRKNKKLAGVPIAFSVSERADKLDEDYFRNGAMIVVQKVLSDSDVLRIENTGYQYENTRVYQREIQKQLAELRSAREIYQLNKQLEVRNELLKKVFGRYFSEDVVSEILEHPEGASLGGKKREICVLMCDLRNFTALSERLDAEQVTSLLNVFFGKMIEAISIYHGTIIEFLGDGLLAVFGAPIESVSQSDDAIAAAISMQNEMVDVNQYCKEHQIPEIEMGIGLHRGDVFVGNVGSEKMMRYNVIGSAVNVCSRIESCSVGGQILVSDAMIKHAKSVVFVRREVEVMVKGLQDPVIVREVDGIEGIYTLELDHSFEEEDDFIAPETGFRLQLHPLDEKAVREFFILAEIQKLSKRRILVSVPMEQADELPELMNVKLSVLYDGIVVMDGVYAKVLEADKNIRMLRLTSPMGDLKGL